MIHGWVCCGVAIAAVAVNHKRLQLANESAVEGFRQHTLGLHPGHMQVLPGWDDSAVLFYDLFPIRIQSLSIRKKGKKDKVKNN